MSKLLAITLILTILSPPTKILAMVVSPQVVESRLRGALWGIFAGDALASPTHWFYGGFPQIQQIYGREGIKGYTKPVKNLPGSILNKSDPNGGGRLSINSSCSGNVSIIGDVINHGKLEYWDPNKSFHYHATLQAGENTLEAQLVRVLMKSIVANGGRFNEEHFRKAYVDFMTTEGSHNDTYASTCHRMFFANLIFRKLDPKDCPDNDEHNVDAIDGLVLPTVTALAETARHLTHSGTHNNEESSGDRKIIGMAAARTSAVTRSSQMLERVNEIWADLIFASIVTPDSMEVPLSLAAKRLGIGRKLQSNGRDQMCACYLSQSLPTALDMMFKYNQQSTLNGDAGQTCWDALIANANVGGENVHRGAVIGAILGARAGDESLPSVLKNGLHDKGKLEKEIDEFVRSVMQ